MKTILVGLDGSPRAGVVLQEAVFLAGKTGAKLILFRSVGMPAEIPHDIWKETGASLVDTLRTHAEAYLAECVKAVPPEMLQARRVMIGNAWQSVCEAAREEKVDLIVIGSHGYSGLDHLLGTTAAKIVNHAACSVLVVRSPEVVNPPNA